MVPGTPEELERDALRSLEAGRLVSIANVLPARSQERPRRPLVRLFFRDPERRRRIRVRAALRAAFVATPVLFRVAAPRRAAASGDRSVPRRRRADSVAWRESDAFDPAQLPARFSAREIARLRLRDGARGSRSPWPPT